MSQDQNQDDSTILDEWRLLRRIPVQPNVYITWDANNKKWIISSQAFKNHDDHPLKMSVHLEPVLAEKGLPLESVIEDAEKFALAAITARHAKANGQAIERDPLPNDPAHAHVIGEKPKKVQKKLRDGAHWVIEPPPQDV